MHTSIPVILSPASAEVCQQCGTFEDDQLSSCCAPGGTWYQQCGKKDGQKLAHTWSEGVQACAQGISVAGIHGGKSFAVPGLHMNGKECVMLRYP